MRKSFFAVLAVLFLGMTVLPGCSWHEKLERKEHARLDDPAMSAGTGMVRDVAMITAKAGNRRNIPG